MLRVINRISNIVGRAALAGAVGAIVLFLADSGRPESLLWGSGALGAIAVVAGLVWWITRRSATRPASIQTSLKIDGSNEGSPANLSGTVDRSIVAARDVNINVNPDPQSSASEDGKLEIVFRDVDGDFRHVNPNYIEPFFSNAPAELVIYRVAVANGRSRQKVKLVMTSIDPQPDRFYGTQAALHIMHNNAPPILKEVEISPGGRGFFDVVGYSRAHLVNGQWSGQERMFIYHLAEDIDQEIPVGDYQITLQAAGGDVPAVEKRFRTWVEDEQLHMEVLE